MDCVTHPIDEWDGPNNKLPRRTSNEYGLSGLDSHTWTLFFIPIAIFINMKKVIRLTESDLTRFVKRVINESKKDPSNKKIESELNKLMDDYVGEDEWIGGHRESSDKPYDRFMVKFKQSGEDTEEIAEEVIEKLNDAFEGSLFKLGNCGKNSFWFYKK